LLEAPAPPPAAVLDLLSHHKAGVVAPLRPGWDGWSAEDWQVFFDERAGIAEFEGGLPRGQAEANAFACCIDEWLNRKFVHRPPERCVVCGGDHTHEPLLPFDIELMRRWTMTAPGTRDGWNQAVDVLDQLGQLD
jgi:hypothetical protein